MPEVERNAFIHSPLVNNDAKGGAYSLYPSPANAESFSSVNNDSNPLSRPHFCDRRCLKYFCGCCCSLLLLLVLAFSASILAPGFGLIVAAVAPSVTILIFTQVYYKDQVTQGQMTGKH